MSGPPPGQSGGVLYLEYSNPPFGAWHSLRLNLAWFDPTSLGGTHDRAYTGLGPVAPTEGSVAETYAAIAALWRPYYSPEWTLVCRSLGYNDGGTDTLLLPAPNFPAHVGSDETDTTAWWSSDRKFFLLGQTGEKRKLWLRHVPTQTLPPHLIEVTPSSGGVDARDRAWMAYLSGASGGGAVMPDGTYTHAVRDMVVEWARAPQLVGAEGGMPGAPYVVSG